MNNLIESNVISLGSEPAEFLGFKTEEDKEKALVPLMAEIFHDENISVIFVREFITRLKIFKYKSFANHLWS
tara:strand:+ start:419 stop:634 length:216 start_codon:yes stop_codon:yes gene_type:complete